MLPITIDLGVPLPRPYKQDKDVMDLRERATAACNTAQALERMGASFDLPTHADMEVAAILAESYAEDPEKASKKVTNARADTLTPASIILAGNILTEFGRTVVQSATQIRQLVTNKLLLETENEDARIRLRALELLGKLSDVGLFTEKSEVTITHQTSDDLRESLKNKLRALASEDIEDAQYEDVTEAPLVIDVDAELGCD